MSGSDGAARGRTVSRSQLLYLDSSALVKLVSPEPETPALLRLLHDWPERVSSVLARVEVLRATRRLGDEAARLRRAEQVLSRIALIRIDDVVLDAAARLAPTDLRSLDAIHLATALSVRRQLGALVTYDPRLAAAARAARVHVLTAA